MNKNQKKSWRLSKFLLEITSSSRQIKLPQPKSLKKSHKPPKSSYRRDLGKTHPRKTTVKNNQLAQWIIVLWNLRKHSLRTKEVWSNNRQFQRIHLFRTSKMPPETMLCPREARSSRRRTLSNNWQRWRLKSFWRVTIKKLAEKLRRRRS